MKREIKFRTWDKQNKRMEHCFYVRGFNILEQHESMEIMQFTGLKDKNGKDIYDGDVVKFHYFYGTVVSGGFQEAEHELTGVINWGVYGWSVEKIKGEHWKGYTGYGDNEGSASVLELLAMNESSIHEESFEIIGNIHDNPELLTA